MRSAMGEAVRTAGRRFLSREQEIAKGRAARSGDVQARDDLVYAVVPLVARLVLKRWRHRRDTQDVFQMAMLQVTRAATMWDPDRGWRWSTYAGATVAHLLTNHRRTTRAIESHECHAMVEMEREIVEAITQHPDHRCPLPPDYAINRELHALLTVRLELLDERRRDVVVRRANGEVLKDIGATLGISGARVNQLELTAMAQLREAFGVEDCGGGVERTRTGQMTDRERRERLRENSRQWERRRRERRKAARVASGV